MKTEALVKQLKAAAAAYYNTGKALMSDDEYDALVVQLRKVDPGNDFLKTVGAPASNLFKPVKHQIPMGSLEKVKDAEELKKWFAKLPVKEVVVQWKYDGASISLEYRNGKLVRAVSRGDGITGEDVTQNVRKSKYIPEELTQPWNGFIRGECILFKDDFTKFFPGGSNPRNQGNGIMRSKDGEGCEHLRVLPYDAVPDGSSDANGFDTETAKLKFLKNNGFDVHLVSKMSSVENIIAAHKLMEEARAKLQFEVDGIVIKCNDVAATETMGESDGRPKAQRAFKFEALGAETKVTGIEWTVGHTGSVVPTFKVESRNIGGVNVGSVLMNNVGYCEAMDVAVGDTVRVTRRGDVIPHIESVLERPKNRKWEPPAKCPSCQGKLVRKDIHLVCENSECAGQKVRLIRRWLTALDIKFIGPEIEQALWNSGTIKDPADLYWLIEKDLAVLKIGAGRLGSDRATQILKEIDKTRELPLHMFMGALGIQFLGTRAAKHMVEDNGLDTIEKFTNPKLIRETESLGPAIREGVAKGVEQFMPVIKKLLKVVKIAAPVKEVKPVPTDKKASGKSFCFTGALPSGMGRNEAQGLVIAAGGSVKDSVSKGLDYLVIADPNSTSSKATKARSIGVTLISEDQFKEMV